MENIMVHNWSTLKIADFGTGTDIARSKASFTTIIMIFTCPHM